jgi:LmbE family N-acetylglucosaminyl deacetylase
MHATYPDDSLVQARPQFVRRDSQLYFLLSRRSHLMLGPAEQALWDRIQEAQPLGLLRQTFAAADETLSRFWKSEVCEFIEPPQLAPRRKVLVVEPHMDDAILSVGGVMWKRRHSHDFTLVTLAGLSNFTSYYELDREYFDVEQISLLRRRESELVMAMLGGRHTALDLAEAPLRYQPGNWALDWYRGHRRAVSAFISHASDASELATWTQAVATAMTTLSYDELWLPMGIGAHTDHELARDASIAALTREGVVPARVEVYFYQDVPYASRFPLHTPKFLSVLESSGAQLSPHAEEISEAMPAKLRMLSAYGSQFKMSYMTPKVEHAARALRPEGNGYFELLYRLDVRPDSVDTSQLYSGQRFIDASLAQLKGWYRRHRNATRIRMLSPMPFGRWKHDVNLLLRAFPAATLEIYVASDTVPETEDYVSSRVRVLPIAGRGRAWATQVARLALTEGLPTILLMGQKRQMLSRISAVMLLRSDCISLPNMTHMGRALEIILWK